MQFSFLVSLEKVAVKYVVTSMQTVSNWSRTKHVVVLCEMSYGLRFYTVFLSP